MIKIDMMDYILFKHIKYINEDSTIRNKLNEFRNEIFFDDKYIEDILNEKYTDDNIKTLRSTLIKNITNKFNNELKNKKDVLNFIHKEFILYLIKNIEEVMYDCNEKLILTKDLSSNIFLAKPQELNQIFNKIINDKFKIISLIIEIENCIVEKKYKINKLYYQNIIDNLGYKNFSEKEIKIRYISDYEEILKLSSKKFYDEYSSGKINKVTKIKKMEEVKNKIINNLNTLNKVNDKLSERYKIIQDFILSIKQIPLSEINGTIISIDKFKQAINNEAQNTAKKFNELSLQIKETISLQNIQKYRDSTSWSAYHFVMELGLKVCPYCNRQYISPIYSEDGKMRGDLDHFLPKYKFPYFSMSIYNLVPSCKFCNSSLKNKKEFSYNKNLNPYEYGFNNLISFTYKINEDIVDINEVNSIDIELKDEIGAEKKLIEKARRNADIFQIENLYNYHKDVILQLIKKRIIYNQRYIDMLYEKNQEIFLNKKDVVKLIVGNSLDEKDLSQKVLSKMINDIAEELGFSKFEISDEDLKILKNKFDIE